MSRRKKFLETFGNDQEITVKKIPSLEVSINNSLELAILLGAVVFKFGYPELDKEYSGRGQYPTKSLVPVEILCQSCVQAYLKPVKLPDHCEVKIIHTDNGWRFQAFFYGKSIRLSLFPEESLVDTVEFHC